MHSPIDKHLSNVHFVAILHQAVILFRNAWGSNLEILDCNRGAEAFKGSPEELNGQPGFLSQTSPRST